MMWLFAVLVVLVMGGVALVASGRGGSMAPAYDDRPDLALPDDRPLEALDLRTVRFPLALRGYRMSDVDDLLARLATELEDAAQDPQQDPPQDPQQDAQDPRRDGPQDGAEDGPDGSGPGQGSSGDAGPV